VKVLAGLLASMIWMQQQAPPPRDTRPPAMMATGRITGVVTSDEAQPRPLRRARVTINGAAPSSGWSLVTGDDGRFSFDGLPPGSYTVGALKDGYVPMNYGATRSGRTGRAIAVAERQTMTVPLRLARGAVITGTVLDVDGQPAPGVRVMVMARRFVGSPASDVAYALAGTPGITTTDDHGVYRVFGLPAGEYVVSARPTTSGEVAPGLAGIAVQMMSRGALSDRRMLLTQVYHPGMTDVARAARVNVRAGEERAGIDVQLQYVPLAAIRGSVSGAAGFSPATLTLWRLGDTGGFQSGPVARADGQGRFEFPSVAPGQYRLAARAIPESASGGGRGAAPADALFAVAEVTVDGDDLEVPLSLQPGLSIAGKVVLDAASGGSADILSQLKLNVPTFLIPASGGWTMPPVVVEGTAFRIDGVMPGLYRSTPNLQGIRSPVGTWWLTSLAGGGRELLDAPLDLQQSIADAVATFSDHVSVVTGTVRDAQGPIGADPASAPWVIAFPANRAFWFTGSRRIAYTKPNRQGVWTIRNLPPGDYRIVVTQDVDQNEWFDPAVLERLTASATPFTIAAADTKTIDLVLR
jgi:uncharacterized protein (DUF2141 family)